MRTNLYSIKESDGKIRRSVQRIASGKKVNSPLDNPTNFFIANTLRNSASDLNELHRAIGEGVNVIKVTGKGL